MNSSFEDSANART
ncbi:unnamed protein product, partial [Rotaria magnacalcarata]